MNKLIISLLFILLGIGIGQYWRMYQVEPKYKAKIELLEDQLRINEHNLNELRTHLGDIEAKIVIQGRKKRGWR